MPLTESMKAHNRSVLQKVLQKQGGSIAEGICLTMLQELGNFVLNWIKDKTYTYEDQTYNLTDSTGCAIYKGGVLTSFEYYAEKQASDSRIIRTRKGKDEPWEATEIKGRELLQAALQGQPLANMGSYSLVVLSAAPYGLWVNESLGDGGPNKRGKGWFDDLKKATEQEFEKIKIAHGLGA